MNVLLPPPFPELLFLSMTSYGMEYSPGQFGTVSQLCPLTAPCAWPVHSLVGWSEKKVLVLWVLLSSNEIIFELSKLFSTNPNHSPISATVKKINALSAKISTLSKIARTTKFSYGRSVFLGIQVFAEKFYFVSFFLVFLRNLYSTYLRYVTTHRGMESNIILYA